DEDRAPERAPPRDVPCLACVRERPPWHGARAPLVFGGALAVAIRRWKLGPVPELTRPLARPVAPALARLAPDAGARVPVPLHPRRLRAREFNQAALLARGARALHAAAPPVADVLERTRDTASQATLDAAARRRNVRGAFRVAAPSLVAGRRLCLV